MLEARKTLTATALLICAAAAVSGGDWPQFRGPNRDGVSAETGLLTSWPEQGPPLLWRVELGEGYSGMAISDGRIYTMFGKGQSEFVVCLDAATGKRLWILRVDEKWVDRFGNGPRSTPTVDGGRVFALSARGALVALDTEDGSEIWRRELESEFGAKPPTWGVSTAPLVEGKLLLVNVGGEQGSSIVAFDKSNGKEVWRSGGDPAGYSAPIAVTAGGVRQIIFFTGSSVAAVSPTEGKILWKRRWKTDWGVNAAAPVFIPPDRIFVSSGYDVGGAVFRVAADAAGIKVEEVWRNREMKNKFSSSVLRNGHLYGFDEKTLKCVDASNGETKWRKRGFEHGSLIYADGHLIVLGERGQLALIEAVPDEYREKAVVQILDGKTWTGPALAGGTLYLRNEKELISLKVSGRAAPIKSGS